MTDVIQRQEPLSATERQARVTRRLRQVGGCNDLLARLERLERIINALPAAESVPERDAAP
ncbi:MAG: hypothetical protein AAF495_22095 [Pseudomonadota bacterium]